MLSALAPGFSRAAVEAVSRQKGEPAWMLQLRLQAWDSYENTPAPLGRRGDLGTLRNVANFKFQNLNPFAPVEPNNSLPAEIDEALQSALLAIQLTQLNAARLRGAQWQVGR